MVRLLAYHLIPNNSTVKIPHVFRVVISTVLRVCSLANRSTSVSDTYSILDLIFKISMNTTVNTFAVVLALISNWVLLIVATPLRLSVRFLYLLGTLLRALILVASADVKNICLLIKFFIGSEFFAIMRSWPLFALMVTLWTSRALVFYVEFSISSYGTYLPAGFFCKLLEVLSYYQELTPKAMSLGGVGGSLVI